MIYVPDLDNYECFVILNENTIRAYEDYPELDSTINYRDYFVNSNYIYRDSSETFNDSIPICLSNDVLTNDFYYRNDLDSILIIFLIICIFAIYLPIKLFKRIFRRLK